MIVYISIKKLYAQSYGQEWPHRLLSTPGALQEPPFPSPGACHDPSSTWTSFLHRFLVVLLPKSGRKPHPNRRQIYAKRLSLVDVIL